FNNLLSFLWFILIHCSSFIFFSFFFFYCYGAHRDLHSFPTRRSSDLTRTPLRHTMKPKAVLCLSLLKFAASGPMWTRRLRTETRSEEHTSELQSQSNLVCRLLLEKKKKKKQNIKKKKKKKDEEPMIMM